MSGPPALPSETGRMTEIVAGAGAAVELAVEAGASELVAADGSRSSIDVVFPVLHGPRGEDGAVQGMLELAGVPYVGAGVLGSAVGMDKAVQKVLFAAAGLSVVPHEVVREPEWEEDPEGVSARIAGLGFPVVHEARHAGLVRRHPEGPRSARAAVRYGRGVPVRAEGRGGEGSRGHPRDRMCGAGQRRPGRVGPGGDRAGRARVLRLRGEVPGRTGRTAVDPRGPEARRRWNRCNGWPSPPSARPSVRGMARVDFFLRGDDELWVNEINTIPGFTHISMYPKLWEASGLSYPHLVERLLDLAVERHAAESTKSTGVRELGGA